MFKHCLWKTNVLNHREVFCHQILIYLFAYQLHKLKTQVNHVQDILKVIPFSQLFNRPFLIRAIHVNAKIIPYLINKVPLKDEIIDEMIKADGMSIHHLNKKLGQENLKREHYLEAVKNNPFAYYKIPKGFQKDPEILSIVRSRLQEEA